MKKLIQDIKQACKDLSEGYLNYTRNLQLSSYKKTKDYHEDIANIAYELYMIVGQNEASKIRYQIYEYSRSYKEYRSQVTAISARYGINMRDFLSPKNPVVINEKDLLDELALNTKFKSICDKYKIPNIKIQNTGE